MNTKQKLTLGIAAIFMVTLTIVGVTYAYFVTRVTGDVGTETVDVTTATLASVEYAEGNNLITMANVLPGAVEYKTFKVINNNAENAAQYDIVLTSYVPESKASFVHTTDPSTSGCYAADAYSKIDELTACFAEGVAYNNIKYSLYETTSDLTDSTDEQIATAINGLDALASANVDYNKTVAAPQSVTNVVIEKGDTQYYVLKIEYLDANANQNIENEAALNIKVDIK